MNFSPVMISGIMDFSNLSESMGFELPLLFEESFEKEGEDIKDLRR